MAVRSAKEKSLNDVATTEIQREINICPPDIGNVMTSDGVMARPFMVGEVTAPFKTNVVIKGYVDFYGGYGNHCREIVLRLGENPKYNVKLDPIKSPVDIHPALYSKMNWYANNMAFKKSDSTALIIAGPGHMRKGFYPEYCKRTIGWTMIETLEVMPEIANWLKNMDLILCPTMTDMRRFRTAGLNNLAMCRIGYNQNEYHEKVAPVDIANLRGRYVFGVAGSWNYRKSVEEIVQAYCMAFTANDPVSLLLVCKYGNRPWGPNKEDKSKWGIRVELQAILDKLTDNKDDLPHICVLDVPMHPEIVPHVYSRFDCLVGFSKGESTWLPGLEIGAMGKPIIQLENEACGYMDYLLGTRYMCKKVKYKECGPELYEGTSEYYEGQKMGFGDTLELSEMMKRVYSERGTGVQVMERKYIIDRVKEYTWENSVKTLCEYI